MKSRIISRRQILTISLIFALSLAVFVNWYYTKPQENNEKPDITKETNLGDAQYVNSNSVNTKNYFENAKINRKKAHDTSKDYLEKIITDINADDETKASARKKLIDISEQIKLENDIENLITAQINSQCLVTIGDDTIEILLPKGVLNNNGIVVIKDIAVKKTKLSTDKITIIEIK